MFSKTKSLKDKVKFFNYCFTFDLYKRESYLDLQHLFLLFDLAANLDDAFGNQAEVDVADVVVVCSVVAVVSIGFVAAAVVEIDNSLRMKARLGEREQLRPQILKTACYGV